MIGVRGTSLKGVDRISAVYCVAALAVALALVRGATGLGPLDDHHLFSTLFQGKPFGYYISPELGRFFPLTAQEYVLAAKIFHPSATLFYAINAAKLIVCGFVLFVCLALAGSRTIATVVLLSVAIFSVGIANTVYRLSAGELNEFCAMLCVAWALLYLEHGDRLRVANRRAATWFALAVFAIALFYKELTFVFGLVLGCAEYLRRWRTGQRRPPLVIGGLALIGACYVLFYVGWRLSVATGSYASLHQLSAFSIFWLYVGSDPFVLLIAIPITVYRAVVVALDARRHQLSDSLLFAATAYVVCYFALGIYSPYYLLPAYAFAIIGVAATLARVQGRPLRCVVLTASLLAFIDTLPVFVADVQRQKEVVNNHFRFVNDLASWLELHPLSGDRDKRTLLLEGVGAGSRIEIIQSLRVYLVVLGVPASSFQVVGSEPTDNAKISTFFKGQPADASQAHPGDLLIFNPYHSGEVISRPRLPSQPLVVGGLEPMVIPRWNGAQWLQFCFFDYAMCAANLKASRSETDYQAYLYEREPKRVPVEVLKAPAYRLDRLASPSSLAAGSVTAIDVEAVNTGTQPWPAIDKLTAGMYVNMAYRWFDASGALVAYGNRVALPEAVLPGDKVSVSLAVTAPPVPGRYRLVIGPVQEGVIWFEGDKGTWIVVTDGKKS